MEDFTEDISLAYTMREPKRKKEEHASQRSWLRWFSSACTYKKRSAANDGCT